MQKDPGAGRIYADDTEGDEDLVAKFTDIIPCQWIVNGCWELIVTVMASSWLGVAELPVVGFQVVTGPQNQDPTI